MRAWIEIISLQNDNFVVTVALFMRAWIEIPYTRRSKKSKRSPSS